MAGAHYALDDSRGAVARPEHVRLVDHREPGQRARVTPAHEHPRRLVRLDGVAARHGQGGRLRKVREVVNGLLYSQVLEALDGEVGVGVREAWALSERAVVEERRWWGTEEAVLDENCGAMFLLGDLSNDRLVGQVGV